MGNGEKIIEGLRQAVAGDLARVTIQGQVWVRDKNSELVRLRAILKTLVDAHDYSSLDRGIGTALPDGKMWLAARAAVAD
jgi:hypothetical protein